MNILIDFTQIPLQKTGVGVYALNLVTKIYEHDKTNSYCILVQDDDDSLDFIQSPRFHLKKVKSGLYRKFLLRLVLEQLYIPYLTVKYKIDIVHSLHYSFPVFCNRKKIVTVCDLTFFKFPRSHVPIKRYYFRFFLYLISFFADDIIAISESTLADFRSLFTRWEKRGHVIYLGKDRGYCPGLDKNKIMELKHSLGITKEYLLFIGTLEPRKNIKNLILSFHKLLQEEKRYQLVIVGKKGWYYAEVFNLIKELQLDRDILCPGFIHEREKPYVLAGAKIFIYPSLYEGFGIPVLEAMSCGVPTITSNISSLPEVAGDAALFADPLNPDDLYVKMKRLLNDEILYARLKQKSIGQAAKFSWDNTALETVTVYNNLLGRK